MPRHGFRCNPTVAASMASGTLGEWRDGVAIDADTGFALAVAVSSFVIVALAVYKATTQGAFQSQHARATRSMVTWRAWVVCRAFYSLAMPSTMHVADH